MPEGAPRGAGSAGAGDITAISAALEASDPWTNTDEAKASAGAEARQVAGRGRDRVGIAGVGVAGRAALGLIRLYQRLLSPVLGQKCRYLPTCSAYAAEAITRHGLWYGGWMAAARLARCHPFGASGFDPVPDEVRPAARRFPWRAGRWGAGHIDPATRLDRP